MAKELSHLAYRFTSKPDWFACVRVCMI